jgi:hypothetical protein
MSKHIYYQVLDLEVHSPHPVGWNIRNVSILQPVERAGSSQPDAISEVEWENNHTLPANVNKITRHIVWRSRGGTEKNFDHDCFASLLFHEEQMRQPETSPFTVLSRAPSVFELYPDDFNLSEFPEREFNATTYIYSHLSRFSSCIWPILW